MKTLDKRKLKKNKEKDIKFNIKRNNIIFDKQETKNDKIGKEKQKTINKRREKNYHSNEEREIKDKTLTLNHFLRGKQINMKIKAARKVEIIILH